MNDEEFKNRMEFIVEHQAQFMLNLEKLEIRQSESTVKHNHLTEALTTVVGMIGKLDERLDRLTAAQERFEATQERTDKKLAETDDRLNVLINVVERYINERRNGHNQTPPANSDYAISANTTVE